MYLIVMFLTSSVVEVNFDQDSYTVAESNGHVSVSLRIDGKFFYPVWAIIEVSSGTATGGLCMIKSLDTHFSYTCVCITIL